MPVVWRMLPFLLGNSSSFLAAAEKAVRAVVWADGAVETSPTAVTPNLSAGVIFVVESGGLEAGARRL